MLVCGVGGRGQGWVRTARGSSTQYRHNCSIEFKWAAACVFHTPLVVVDEDTACTARQQGVCRESEVEPHQGATRRGQAGRAGACEAGKQILVVAAAVGQHGRVALSPTHCTRGRRGGGVNKESLATVATRAPRADDRVSCGIAWYRVLVHRVLASFLTWYRVCLQLCACGRWASYVTAQERAALIGAGRTDGRWGLGSRETEPREALPTLILV